MKGRNNLWLAGFFLIVAGMVYWEMYGSRFARGQRALAAQAERIGAPTSIRRFPTLPEMAGAGPFPQAKWFNLIWGARRLAAWEQRLADRGAVVFAGDSIFQLWSNLERAFPNCKTANRGIMGDTTRGLRHRFTEDVLALEPRAVVWLCGINDLSDGAAPAEAVENIGTMMAQCQKQNPNRPLILCTVLPTGPDAKDRNLKIQEFNRALKQLSAGTTNVWVVDTWAALADANGAARTNDFLDLLHPNEAGYAKLAAQLRPLLEQILRPAE